MNITFNEISNNHKFVIDIFGKIPEDLIIKDYITYYLQKYKNKDDIYHKDDSYHKIIDILLKLRFNEKSDIIKNNKENKINILLIKMMWIESNVNYILNIFRILEYAIKIFNDNENKLFQKMEELLFKENNIKYIIDGRKNLSYTKEVNESYYILLTSIFYCITSDEIKLNKINDYKKNDESEIEINYYYNNLKEINKILQNLNDNLYLFLNEIYILDELIQIIELFIKSKNIEKIYELKNLLRENALIIQKYSNNTYNASVNEELINNFEIIYNNIMENEEIMKKK